MLDVFDYITKRLSPLAFSLTKNEHDAEDLIQDTLLRCLNMGERYNHLVVEQRQQVAATTMRNIFLDHKRKKKHVTAIYGEEYIPESAADPVYENIGDKICKAVKKIGVTSEAYILYYLGYTQKDVSALMNIPIGSAKSRIDRGRKFLQDELMGKEKMRKKSPAKTRRALKKIIDAHFQFHEPLIATKTKAA